MIKRYGFRKVWPKCCLIFGPRASPYGANGQITMTLHNYRSRQVHETLNGVNPSSGFRDMRSAKSGPNLCQIWQVLGPGASPYGANGQMTWQCTTTGLDYSTELRIEKIRQAVTEIWVPQFWQLPARPPGPWRQYPSSPEGWGVKTNRQTKQSNKKITKTSGTINEAQINNIILTVPYRYQFYINVQRANMTLSHSHAVPWYYVTYLIPDT